MDGVRVALLGAAEVFRDGVAVDLGTPKQRAVFAALSLHRGRPVSSDLLLDLVWGDDLPPGAPATLQTYIAKLRRTLEPDRPPRAAATILVTATSGYALRLDDDAFDVARFEKTVMTSHRGLTPTTAYGLPPESVSSARLRQIAGDLDEALGLWHGMPFTDLGDAPDAVAERVRLDELRVVALEDRAAALLALGEHATVVAELESLTRAFPLRERLWGLHAVALVRTSRQAEALEVLGQVRRMLDEELGLEPGPELRDLQTAILRQDPDLAWAPEARSSNTEAVSPPDPARTSGATPAPLPPWPLVGRDAHLDLLTGLLSHAERGTPVFASLLGEPGIGKSRLALELAHVAADRGFRLALGRCSQDDGAPPLWPWRAVLSALGRELPTDPGAEDEGARFRSWEAIAGAVLDEARRAALIVVLEDLHWADTSSLRVLRLLLESASDASLLVLMTWRLAPEPTGALADVAESLARLHATRIELSGLTVAEAASVVAALSGEALCQQRLSPDQASALRDRTDGNPFFLVEYARLARDRGDLAAILTEAVPPAAVHDVLVRRVQRLPEITQRLLAIASVIGREFDLITLARAVPADEDEVLDGLDAALTAGLLSLTGPETFSFAHALVRDTVYAGLGSRRARAHARVARAIESLPGFRASELVRHWVEAGPAFASEARRAAEAAAAAARRVYAYEEAADLLGTALRAIESDREATPRDRYDVLLALAEMQRWAGNWEGLVATVESSIRVADEIGDVELLANAAIQTTIGALWHSAGYGEVHPGVVDALRRSLNRLPAQDSALRCRTMLSLANEIYYGSTSQERDALTEQAIAMAHRLDDPSLLIDAYLTSYMSTRRAATAGRRLEYAARAHEIAQQIGEQRAQAVSECLVALACAELGQIQEMWNWAAIARVSCERLRIAYGVLVLDNLLLPWHAMAGRFDRCEEILESLRVLDESMSLAQYDDAAAGAALCIALWQRNTADLVPLLLTLEAQTPLPVTTLVTMFQARAGLAHEAREHLAAHPVSLTSDDWFSKLEWAAAAETALAVGDTALAARAYDKLAPYAGESCCAGPGMHSGPVDAYLALAAAATGERSLACGHADSALELCERWDIPLVDQWLRNLRQAHRF